MQRSFTMTLFETYPLPSMSLTSLSVYGSLATTLVAKISDTNLFPSWGISLNVSGSPTATVEVGRPLYKI